MKPSGFPMKLSSLYVLAAGILGSIIPLIIFDIWNELPVKWGNKGKEFSEVPEYWVWIFLFMILFALLAIFFIPAWLSLIKNFQTWILNVKEVSFWKSVLGLFFAALLLVGFLLVMSQIVDIAGTEFQSLYPPGHKDRIKIASACIAIVLIPIVLVIILLGDEGQRLLSKIQKDEQVMEQLFEIIDELLELRRSLQTHLMIAGLILSMIPLLTAGLRAIIIAIVGESNKDIFPITLVIVYGLAFTSLLVYIYAPVHLSLTECSRELRDKVCPITSLDGLEDTIKKRKTLDELLQTNIGIGQNLKSGVATLAPLITGLLVSLLGINP